MKSGEVISYDMMAIVLIEWIVSDGGDTRGECIDSGVEWKFRVIMILFGKVNVKRTVREQNLGKNVVGYRFVALCP